MPKKRNNKKTNKILISLVVSILIIIVLLLCGKNEQAQKYFENLIGINISSQNTETNKIKSTQIDSEDGIKTIVVGENNSNKTNENIENLKVYYIDVGQADSILIMNNGESALIDAGNNEDGQDVVNFIKSKGITKLNYVIGTHPHEDHIGGLDDVINNIDIDKIYLPKIQTTTKTYQDVLTAIQNKNKTINTFKKGDKFSIGEANSEIMTDSISDKNNLNLSSNIIRMEYNKTSFLFTGDAETENEKAIEWSQTDILKVGHHGSKTSTSQKFLNQIKPTYAIISVGKDNDYGHPNKETLDKLKNIGAQVIRTDESGTIEIIVTK